MLSLWCLASKKSLTWINFLFSKSNNVPTWIRFLIVCPHLDCMSYKYWRSQLYILPGCDYHTPTSVRSIPGGRFDQDQNKYWRKEDCRDIIQRSCYPENKALIKKVERWRNLQRFTKWSDIIWVDKMLISLKVEEQTPQEQTIFTWTWYSGCSNLSDSPKQLAQKIQMYEWLNFI